MTHEQSIYDFFFSIRVCSKDFSNTKVIRQSGPGYQLLTLTGCLLSAEWELLKETVVQH